MPQVRRAQRWHLTATIIALTVAPTVAAAQADQQASAVRPRPPASEPPTTPAPAAPPGPPLTADDVANAPVPGEESGRADVVDTGDSTARQIARGLLFFPRLALDVALSPVRGSVYAIDRYHLPDLYDRVFWNDALTIGLYPTMSIDTSLGITLGARFEHKDLFGKHEQLGLLAAVGSRYRQIYSATLRSGNRFDRLGLELDAGYERRPHDTFYGIGNGDGMSTAPAAPIDPTVDPTSVEAHYREARMRVSLLGDVRTWRRLHVRVAGALSRVRFGAGDEDPPIDMVYDPRGLVGFGGIEYGYGEFDLRWDDRRASTPWEPPAVFSAGSLADVFGGRVVRLDDGTDFWRYGVDLQHFLRIAGGPRTLAFHLRGEGVTGSRDEVPFLELPRLGGSTYLRGYDLDRFRDRVAAFGSLAYGWDLSQWFSGAVFVDVGRVYPSVGDLSLDHLRMGYGIGIEAHRDAGFVLMGSVASSIDGGLFLNLSFNPAYDIDERVRRR